MTDNWTTGWPGWKYPPGHPIRDWVKAQPPGKSAYLINRELAITESYVAAWRHPDNPFRVEGESEEDTFRKAIAVFQQQEKELVAKRHKERRSQIIYSAISGGGVGLVIGFFLSAMIGWEGALAATLMGVFFGAVYGSSKGLPAKTGPEWPGPSGDPPDTG